MEGKLSKKKRNIKKFEYKKERAYCFAGKKKKRSKSIKLDNEIKGDLERQRKKSYCSQYR